MANNKSAKKNILINKRNRVRNVNQISKMRTFIKRAQEAIEAHAENQTELVREACKLIDKTLSKGMLKKNNAARKKSKLSKKLNKALSAKPTKETPKKKTAKPKATKTAKPKVTKTQAAKKKEAPSKTKAAKADSTQVEDAKTEAPKA